MKKKSKILMDRLVDKVIDLLYLRWIKENLPPLQTGTIVPADQWEAVDRKFKYSKPLSKTMGGKKNG